MCDKCVKDFPSVNKQDLHRFDEKNAAMDIELKFTEFIKEHDKKILKKGTDLFFNRHAEIELVEKDGDNIVISIPSQSTDDIYIVSLDIENELVIEECDCMAFDTYGSCKHCVAAALYLLHTECSFSLIKIQQFSQLSNYD